jgi:hypothetical protein
MKRSPVVQELSFNSKLERIAPAVEYYAVTVPAEITRAVGTRGPVPVSARVNGSTPFLVSLYPRGGGRHGMRIKAGVRSEVRIKGGDRVRVEIKVLDRSFVSIPKDFLAALRAERLTDEFKALPPGKQNYTIRRINEAAQPETRLKRIKAALIETQQRRGKALRRRS